MIKFMKGYVLFAFLTFALNACTLASPNSDEITVTIHANVDPKTTTPTWLGRLKSVAKASGLKDAYRLLAEAESVSAGHAWISVKQSATCRTYGLFNGGPRTDQEKKYDPGIHRSQKISQTQLRSLQEAIRKRTEYQWTGYYNCASYATDLWKEATGEIINPVPVKTFYVDSKGNRGGINQNILLEPLPPSPLGVVQEIIRLGNGGSVTDSGEFVCP